MANNSVQISQLTSILSTLNTMQSSGASLNSSFLNSIFGSSNLGSILGQISGSSSLGNLLSGGYNAYQGLSSNDTDSQIQGLFSLMSCGKEVASKILSMLVPNEAATAASEVAENTAKNTENTNQIITLARTGNEEIDKYIAEAEKQLNVVNEETKSLETKNQEIEAKKEALAEQKEIIYQNTMIINEPCSADSEKQSAIAAIKGATTAITGLAMEVTAMCTEVASIGNNILNASSLIGTQMEGASNTLIKQLGEMEQFTVQKTTEGATEITKTATKGATNQATGVTLQAIAAAEASTTVFTFGAGGVAAAKTQASAIDQLTAGGTRLGSIATNMSNLGKFLGSAGSEMTSMASYANTIGAIATTAAGVVGAATTQMTGLLTSIGSWETVTNDVDAVTTAITNYESTLQTNNTPDGTQNESNTAIGNTNNLALNITNLFNLEVAKTESK